MKKPALIIFLGLGFLQPAGYSQEQGADPFQYLRRVYLRLADRTPSGEEVKAFIREADLEALTNQLLESDDFVKSRARFWEDYLNITEPKDREWLRAEIKENTPINARIAEWFTRQRTPAPDLQTSYSDAAKLGSSLLGMELQCAQCHDHPYQRWQMMDFMKLAGFMNNAGGVVLPEDYPYTNGKGGAVVPAETPFGKKVKMTVSPVDLRKLQVGKIGPRNERVMREFGGWLTNFLENPLALEVLGARYEEWLTGRTDLVGKVWQRRGDSGLMHELPPLTKALKLERYDEVSVIRSFVNGPVFSRRATEGGEMRSSRMSRNQWLDSIESALGTALSNRDAAPGPSDSFLEQAVFLDAVLAKIEFPDRPDVTSIWLETLTRPPKPNEMVVAEQFRNRFPDGVRELYGAIFLSDEFQTAP